MTTTPAHTVKLATTVQVGRFDVTVSLPEVSPRRLVTTTSMASTATGLWLAAPGLLPLATVDARMVLCGVAIPFGVGYVTLLLAERRARRDLTAAARQKLLAETGGGR